MTTKMKNMVKSTKNISITVNKPVKLKIGKTRFVMAGTKKTKSKYASVNDFDHLVDKPVQIMNYIKSTPSTSTKTILQPFSSVGEKYEKELKIAQKPLMSTLILMSTDSFDYFNRKREKMADYKLISDYSISMTIILLCVYSAYSMFFQYREKLENKAALGEIEEEIL
ncbi:hypothetical protein MHBO_000545 [Bonamia ostreae]|uniref:Uncharacterized protein n=1 Tax=Bonamia ostreae TaxID=126728 RepID=A0ABV2AG16_9EUKA